LYCVFHVLLLDSGSGSKTIVRCISRHADPIDHARDTGHRPDAFCGNLSQVPRWQNPFNNHSAVINPNLKSSVMLVAGLMKSIDHLLTEIGNRKF
jgi:hypothetical protein